jgi:hypothetical protein
MFDRVGEVSADIAVLAQYVCELSLVEANFVAYKPSLLAAGAMLFAMKMKKTGNWSSTLEDYTGYKKRDLIPCVVQLNRLNRLSAEPPRNEQTAVRQKYSSRFIAMQSIRQSILHSLPLREILRYLPVWTLKSASKQSTHSITGILLVWVHFGWKE